MKVAVTVKEVDLAFINNVFEKTKVLDKTNLDIPVGTIYGLLGKSLILW